MGHDEFMVPEEDKPKFMIAELWYRLDVNQMEHEREVLLIEDFFGALAGLWDLLLTIFAFIFGGIIQFQAKLKWIRYMYKFNYKDDDKLNNSIKKNSNSLLDSTGKMQIDNLPTTRIYLRNYSLFRHVFKPFEYCCRCCKISNNER